MKCSQFNFYVKDNYMADGKARLDISAILRLLDILDVYKESSNRVARLLRQMNAIFHLGGNDILYVQYPAGRKEFVKLARMVYGNRIKIAAYIHDLDSIRTHDSVDRELEFLKNFDCLISHNSHMTEYLRKIGYQKDIINLEIFDYLHDYQRNIIKSDLSATVCFAGNLNKSKFIAQISNVKSLKFELYGVCDNPQIFGNSNVNYNGCIPAAEIPYCLNGAFGLVWDGESIETCAGELGEYLKYNNPHKLSLYMAAGKPVIVWRHSASADFVTKNKVGIAVESLHEASDIINHMTENEYQELLLNTLTIKKRMAEGYYTKRAAEAAQELVRRRI